VKFIVVILHVLHRGVAGRGDWGKRGRDSSRRLSGFFLRKNWLSWDVWPAFFQYSNTVLSIRSDLWASNMPHMRWRPGFRPGPLWERSQRSPDPLICWGGDISCPIHSLGAWILALSFCAPNVKSWLRLWFLHCVLLMVK